MINLRAYRDLYNARLFPLRRFVLGDAESKRPAIKDWPSADYDLAELATKFKNGHGIAWALSPNDLVIDVDVATAERPDKVGDVSLKKLEDYLGLEFEPKTTYVTSPAGGRHYYLTKPEDVSIVKKLRDYPGLDFLSHGAYVVAAGSPHWQGGDYSFNDVADLIGYHRDPCPPLLLDLLKRPDFTESGDHQTAEVDEVVRLLDCLDPCDFREHDDWFQVFAACHSSTNGSSEGCDAFVAWSTLDPKYSGAAGDIRHRWRTLKQRDGGITIRTLLRIVAEQGDPEKTFEAKVAEAQLEFSPVETTPGPPKVYRVNYALDEHSTNDKVITALAGLPDVFQRGGLLVKVVHESPARVLFLNTPLVREYISSVVELGTWKTDKDGATHWSAQRIPNVLAEQIKSRGSYPGVRELNGIAETPLFLPSGSVLQTPGYNEETGIFYTPSATFPPIPDSPTKADAEEALKRVADVVVDFPFKSEAHKSVFVAAVLTLLARPAIDGPCPLFFVDGNTKGVGKTLLASLVSQIACGRPMAKSPYPKRNEEMTKIITSIAMAGSRCQMFDNIPNGCDFGFASLDAVLTSDVWQDRILGKSELTAELPFKTVLFATGNGLSTTGESDTVRRIAYCMLDAKVERPDARTQFKHGRGYRFNAWVEANRPSLVRDGLTALSAYFTAGRPDMGVPSWGSFASWSDVVRQTIVFSGLPDPYETVADLAEADNARDDLATVLEGLELVIDDTPKTSSEIRDELYQWEFKEGEDGEDIIKACRPLLAPRVNSPDSTVGRRLAAYKGKVYNGKRLELITSTRPRRWTLVTV